ncbi:MAG: hypothetical protein GY768_15665 [Planctomycetaceae bacterium]|nr:hypothetical protein [Planctomycetaceae bacterium]
MKYRILPAAILATLLFNLPVWSAVSIGSPDDCDQSTEVVFDKLGVINPQYTVSGAPIYDSITVSMGSVLAGQTLGTMPNTLDQSTPTGPLQLATNAPNVETLFDLSLPTDIVVGGSDNGKYFTTPLAILFDKPVSHVCFYLGDLDVDTPTVIEAYASDGSTVERMDNLSPGTHQYSVGESSGASLISGISIYIPEETGGMDWEGFAVSDLRVGVVPEPGTVAIWTLLGVAAFSAAYSVSRSREVQK